MRIKLQKLLSGSYKTESRTEENFHANSFNDCEMMKVYTTTKNKNRKGNH